MKVIYNEKCSKCRAVKAILDERGVQWTAIHYLDAGIDEALIAELKEKTGLPLSGLMRNGDVRWAEWGLDPANMEESALVEQILKHPVVLQRPIAIEGNCAVIARPPELVVDLI